MIFGLERFVDEKLNNRYGVVKGEIVENKYTVNQDSAGFLSVKLDSGGFIDVLPKNLACVKSDRQVKEEEILFSSKLTPKEKTLL